MVLRGENMIITNDMEKYKLNNYSNKNNKISREIKKGKLFKIITGLYEMCIRGSFLLDLVCDLRFVLYYKRYCNI